MRRAIPILVALGALVAPAAAAPIDPTALVLGTADVPVGFRLDRSDSGLRTNAREVSAEPQLASLFRRWKRVTGAQAAYARGEARIASRVDVLAAPAGAREMLAWYDLELRKAGVKGLGRAAASVGERGWIYASRIPGSVTIVVWRQGRVFAAVLGQGLGRARSLALARRQQQKIAAAFR